MCIMVVLLVTVVVWLRQGWWSWSSSVARHGICLHTVNLIGNGCCVAFSCDIHIETITAQMNCERFTLWTHTNQQVTTKLPLPLLLGVKDDLTRLHCRPLVTLNVIRQTDERRKDTNSLDQHALAIVELWLGCPPQEGGHVFSDLGG